MPKMESGHIQLADISQISAGLPPIISICLLTHITLTAMSLTPAAILLVKDTTMKAIVTLLMPIPVTI